MFELNSFIASNVIHRAESMFSKDIENNYDELSRQISNKRVLVIGGAGSIGSSYIKALLRFNPSQLLVVDINENGLTELTRDLRSSSDIKVPEDYRTYPINYSDPIFEKIFREERGFDIVANFSAHKHVRSEKDRFSVEALIENNVIKAFHFLNLIAEFPPKHFFCVSTDKAANPVNIMGASKKVMEEMIMSFSDRFKVSTARFANVAFSNGSLPAGFIERLNKKQPIAAPTDVLRYFVSPEESGQICMLACVLGQNREIFFPKLGEEQMITFSSIAESFLRQYGYSPLLFTSDEEAKSYAAKRSKDDDKYPVVFFTSDTTGEKSFEEFYIEGEDLDMERFVSLGVITNVKPRAKRDVDMFLKQLVALFANETFTKQQVVETLKTFIPNFSHEEKGKNLDQKM